MIKRFDFVDTTDATNADITGVMQESEEGAYVLYSDHKRLLDAAHKALESQDDKTVEQHRAEFEEWVARAYVISGGGVLALQKGGYKHKLIREMWRAWKAARGLNP